MVPALKLALPWASELHTPEILALQMAESWGRQSLPWHPQISPFGFSLCLVLSPTGVWCLHLGSRYLLRAPLHHTPMPIPVPIQTPTPSFIRYTCFQDGKWFDKSISGKVSMPHSLFKDIVPMFSWGDNHGWSFRRVLDLRRLSSSTWWRQPLYSNHISIADTEGILDELAQCLEPQKDWSLMADFPLDFLGLLSVNITIIWTKGTNNILNEKWYNLMFIFLKTFHLNNSPT